MKEQDMYDSIGKALGRNGFKTIRRFSFPHPLVQKEERQADVVGFRWSAEGDVEAVAVEAKVGDAPDTPLWSIPQAVVYQVLFPSVYVASATPPCDVDFSRKVLCSLGLGHIEASSHVAHVLWEPKPRDNKRYDEAAYLKDIRPAAALALTVRDFAQQIDEGWDCNKSAARFCIWTKPRDRVQIQFALSDGNVYLGCYCDARPVCRAIGKNAVAERIAGLLSRVPGEYERHHYVHHDRRLGKNLAGGRFDDDVLKLPDENVSTVRDALHQVREWSSRGTKASGWEVGTFAFRFKLWDRSRVVCRSEAEAIVHQLLPHVLAIREYLHEAGAVG